MSKFCTDFFQNYFQDHLFTQIKAYWNKKQTEKRIPKAESIIFTKNSDWFLTQHNKYPQYLNPGYFIFNYKNQKRICHYKAHKKNISKNTHKKSPVQKMHRALQYKISNFYYSAAGVSVAAVSAAGASADVSAVAGAAAALFLERRVRVVFLAAFSFNIFSL